MSVNYPATKTAGYALDMLKERIAASFRNARESQDLTVREVAERASVSYQYVSMVENGAPTSNPTVEALEKLCRALGLDVVIVPALGSDRERVDRAIQLLPGAPPDLVDGFLFALEAMRAKQGK